MMLSNIYFSYPGLTRLPQDWKWKNLNFTGAYDNPVQNATLVVQECRVQGSAKNSKNGGVYIFVREGIKLETIDLCRFAVEFHGEFASVRLPNENLIFVSLYRSPNERWDNFFINFELVIWHGTIDINLAVCGDYNIDLANNLCTPNSNNCLNILRSLNLFCCTTAPTRGSSCLDSMLVNFSKSRFKVTFCPGCYEDHVPMLMEISLKKPNTVQKQTQGEYGRPLGRKICFRKQIYLELD